MPDRVPQSQIDAWLSLPVIVTGKPSAAAVAVIMQSIEKFGVEERVGVQASSVTVEEAG